MFDVTTELAKEARVSVIEHVMSLEQLVTIEEMDLEERGERLADLMAENAKLWELVDELYPLADYGAVDASELDRAHDLMRELGVWR